MRLWIFTNLDPPRLLQPSRRPTRTMDQTLQDMADFIRQVSRLFGSSGTLLSVALSQPQGESLYWCHVDHSRYCGPCQGDVGYLSGDVCSHGGGGLSQQEAAQQGRC